MRERTRDHFTCERVSFHAGVSPRHRKKTTSDVLDLLLKCAARSNAMKIAVLSSSEESRGRVTYGREPDDANDLDDLSRPYRLRGRYPWRISGISPERHSR
jgi:hypothetical protein